MKEATENTIFLAILIPAFIVFIFIGRHCIRKAEKRYQDEMEEMFLNKKKE
jgi:hypothetical protein